MNKQNLVNCLTAGLLIFVSIIAFALPVTAQAQYSQYSQATQLTNSLQLRIDKIKAEIINIMGEMVNMIALEVEELTLNFNKHFNLLPEESEIATSTATTTEQATTTATTTEEIQETPSQSYVSGSQPPSISCPLTPSGVQTYTVTTKNVPTISQIKLDPFDIVFNSMQTITATISDTNPITSVAGLASTDTRTTPFNLTLNSGTSTSGTWQGTWILKDSVCTNFMLTITASSNSGTSKVDLTVR